jgi:sugar phosphate isomerase/epimerase
MDLLSVNNDRLCGFHIHDVTGHDQDHQELGTGSVDFEQISQFFRPDQALVLELHPRMPVEGVRASHEYLLDLLKRKDSAT